MKVPEGREGDLQLGLAAARAIASPGYPFDEAEVRQRIERDQVSGVRDAAAQSRQVGAKWHGPARRAPGPRAGPARGR